MKKIVRSCSYQEVGEKVEATENCGLLDLERLKNLGKAEAEVAGLIADFYQQSGEAPSVQYVYDHFEKANNSEAVTYVEECLSYQPSVGAVFEAEFEEEVEAQSSDVLVRTLKEGIKIATTGHEVNRVPLKGTDAAISHVFSSAEETPKKNQGRHSSNMSKNAQSLTDMYQERKNNPATVYGVPTGYSMIDSATGGIQKKQLYLHAGFQGHMKSTFMMNIIVNSVCQGWNPMLFTSEMPAEEVMLALIAIHSGNPMWGGVGKPLNGYRLRLGALSDEEETFFEQVKDDLLTNSQYGQIRVVDSGEFTTFGSVMQRTLREHSELEVDMLWVDYITRLPVDAKYQRMDITSARNETIADAKRFAMSFNKGEGLPVASPFQINRTGFKQGQADEGKMGISALGQYNAAEKEADLITYIFYGEEEQATSEPKVGMMKSRWGAVQYDPQAVFVDPDCRRITDLSSGMAIQSAAPTGGGEDEVSDAVDL